MGLSLLQGDTLPSSVSKTVLREKMYAAALHYFRWECDASFFHGNLPSYFPLLFLLPSVPPRYPTQTGSDLRDDIATIISFWQAMHYEKKYLSMPNVGNEAETLSQMSGGGSGAGGSLPGMGAASVVGVPAVSTGPAGVSTSQMSTISKRSSTGTGKRGTAWQHPDQDTAIKKEYMRRRNLILSLVVSYITRLLLQLMADV